MASSAMIKAAGLHTFNSYLSAIPEGALFKAENVNIDRAGVIEPRRGITQFATLTSPAKQLLIYKDKLFAQYGTDILALISNLGVVTPIPNADIEPVEPNLRIKSVESNGNLYITTKKGIKRFSSDSTITNYEIELAGGIKPVGVTAVPDYSAGSTFMLPFSKVGYRVTWGKIDKNENFIEGPPSPLIEVINATAQPCAVKLTIDTPPQVDTTYFFRIYRTAVFDAPNITALSDVTINDELKLVYEQAHTGVSSYTITDIEPTIRRDTNEGLYTNEFSGEGILQANEAPPLAKDIALYANHMFYANTLKKHNLLLTLLGTEKFVSVGALEDTIKITNTTLVGPNTKFTFSANHSILPPNPNTYPDNVIIYKASSPSSPPTAHVATVVRGLGEGPNELYVQGDFVTNVDNLTIHSSRIITERLPTFNIYHFVGRKTIFDLAFEGYANAGERATKYPATRYVTLFSADGIKYVLWFAIDTNQLPPNVSDAVFIKVNLAPHSSRTSAQMADLVETAFLDNSYDFDVAMVYEEYSATKAYQTDDFAADYTTGLVYKALQPSTGQPLTNPTYWQLQAGLLAGTLEISTNVSGYSSSPSVANPGAPITLTIKQIGYGEDVTNKRVRLGKSLSPSINTFITANSLAKLINKNTSEIIYAYYLYDANGLPGKILLETKNITDGQFFVKGDQDDVKESFNPALNASSSDERRPNRIYYSKVQQPDAVPIVNYIDIGPRDEAILRIVALRESMFIFKEKSIYRLSGDAPSNFFIQLHDNSAALVTPDALTVLNNSIYALTTQGVSQITVNGLSVLSRPIEDKITKILAPRFKSILHTVFAASYEQDRAFFLWVPKLEDDTYAKECYRYNVFTNTWTSWNVNARAAIVHPVENRLYKSSGDINEIERERKDLLRKDYADRQYPKQLPANSIVDLNKKIISINTVNIEKGDTLVQAQVITISQINRLVEKIENDPAATGLNYSMRIAKGDDPTAFLNNLLNKLKNDGILPLSVNINFAFDIQNVALQTAFNQLVTALNAPSSTIVFKTFTQVTETIDVELLVESVDTVQGSIKVLAITPILQGNLTLYKAIKSEVIYAPITFGDPVSMKHIRVGTAMFANADLAFGNLSYSTDLSPNYEGVDFTLEGDGSWGTFFYSSTTWGGEGTQRPFRTLIPRQKQRCRFIRPRFVHSTAFYKYLLYGVSFDLELTNTRGYK
jgi:hypothetical protein